MRTWGLVALLGLVMGTAPTAQAIPERKGYVNDYANVLSSATLAELETLLAEREDSPLVVLIVPNLEGLNVEDYDEQLTAAWELGDRHLLLLVALEESVVRLSVGEEVRALYPDELLDAVLKETILPALAAGDFDRGVRQGVRRLLGLPAERVQREGGPFEGPLRLLLLAGLIAASVALFVWLRP